MGFIIYYDASYLDIEAFYPFDDWDEEWDGWSDDEEEINLRTTIKSFIDNRYNEGEFLKLLETYKEEYDFGIPVSQVLWNYGKLVVEDGSGNEIYSNGDYYFQDDLPEPKDVVGDCVSREFCILKIYENSGRVYYESIKSEEFDISLLKYRNGSLSYGGIEFAFSDGDGMSSYYEIYKNGERLE